MNANNTDAASPPSVNWVVTELYNDEECLPSGSDARGGVTIFPNKEDALNHAYHTANDAEDCYNYNLAPLPMDPCGAYRGDEMAPGMPGYVIDCEPLIMGKLYFFE
jgi:hypothetical protein